MTNRNGRRVGEPEELTRETAIQILRRVFTAHTNHLDLRPGDIVQSKRHFAGWSGSIERERSPLIVLAYYPDVSVITGEPKDKGVSGIKFARLHPLEEGVEVMLMQAWHFELYDGPMPDKH